MAIKDFFSFLNNSKSKTHYGELTNNQLEELMYVNNSGSSVLSEFKKGDYENSYSSVNKIVQGFASIEPYLINSNGDMVENNILDNLYNPNKQMSAYDFREALMLMFMIWNETYIRVHYNGRKDRNNNIRPDSITGFTFLEGVTPTVIEGKRHFFLKNLELDDDEVLTINSANPYDLNKGYSPSRAARRWTRLDDYIADYQSGFFKNGAVPSGQFIVTAKTVTEYKDIVNAMKAKHQGAGKNNNVVYSYRPTDLNGVPQNSQIEWIPFNSNNSNMALKEIFDAVNQKVDSAFGVPSEIRGHLENSNYASVNVAEKIFVDYTLRPLAFKLWDKMTHELIRVTGGFDAAITFDLPSPKIADEDKIKSEAKKIDADNIISLTQAGYDIQSVIKAFNYDESYSQLEIKEPDMEEPEVQDLVENNNKPSQNIDNKQMTLTERDEYERKLTILIRDHLQKHIEPIINTIELNSKALGDNKESDSISFADAMLVALIPLVLIYGRKEQAVGLSLLVNSDLKTNNVKAFEMSKPQEALYSDYLKKIAIDFDAQTGEAIRNVLKQAEIQGLPVAQVKENLRTLINDDYRVRRLAVSEVNRAQNRAGLYSMENIARDTGYTIKKIWKTTGANPCSLCQELAGTAVNVTDSFWHKGDSIIGVDGAEYKNNFMNATTADAHPHCQCVQVYEVQL